MWIDCGKLRESCGKMWMDCGELWQVVGSSCGELWGATTHHIYVPVFVVSCGRLATTHHNPPHLTTTRCGELWQVVVAR